MHNKDAAHLDLLFNISELANLVTASSDLESFLTHSVDLVARHFSAPVCSIYLYNETSGHLTLKATKGLKSDAVNKIHMEPGEGLVGRSFETLSIIREGHASKTPGFKYFPEAGEDLFNSFLCVPIKRGVEKIGVLAVQHQELNYFDISDERAIRAVVAQLSGAIENARLLMELSQTKDEQPPGRPLGFIKGKGATGGQVLGKAILLDGKQKSILHDRLPGEDQFTKADFLQALEKTALSLKELQQAFARRLPESASLIFTAHFMILKDKNFIGKMGELMDKGTLPCDAVREIAGKYIDIFTSSPHEYMKEKALDVEDLAVRILHNFNVQQDETAYEKGGIAIARQIYPSDILKLVSGGIKGIILAGGGITSHVTILARSLQIPLIIAEAPGLLTLADDTTILMDGDQGNLYINPEKETLALFKTRVAAEQELGSTTMEQQTLTRDRVQVKLLANINLLGEIALARRLNAEGIGLYRTEFPFLIRSSFPSEAEQYHIYKRLFDEAGAMSVNFRTLDAGGEKTLAYSNLPKEANPELGLKSIRFSLEHRDLFESQIRAILRAAAGKKNVGIMFPLVSSIDEFIEAKQIVLDCMETLCQESLEFNDSIKTGVMVELPCVIETIDAFAREADFFSIGTNDLIQYMLGADRANPMVADYYIPHHPAVNKGIAKIASAARNHGIEVTVCGEMAHEPKHIPFLLGVGIRSLSVDPRFLPRVQQTVMGLSMEDAEKYAGKMLAQTRVSSAKQVLDSWDPAPRPAP
ncbi:Pdp [Desulforapulum autotrophicum HRM2]|uniref:phosphoenolpyruvate--protein phosphotransferase n=1 Tax=Desulforapulum autotrophicum (strain ATCC 43914 / DSM 3382 / VKM B-1955 / HRM2) TaxID=177437 RepID=C0QF51_DESAH|nr:phosphoenolpyruvate--protein phosphotransferase [Desulforapulum autotrophicum]ACN17552.1 Pdp [Desulforapulum autotrophicum HRM2]